MDTTREGILKLGKDGEERLLVSQLLGKPRQAQCYQQLAATFFLELHQQALCRQAMARLGQGEAVLAGGFPQAERRCALFLPDYWESLDQVPPEELPFQALRVEARGTKELTHRDYLGSLMGLGIRREMVGDILTGPQGADLLLMGEIVPYVAQNLQKVGNAPVACTPLPLSQLEPPLLKVKVLRDTVASLRLDAVLTVAFSISRGEAAELVRRGLVQVDGLEMTKPDRPVEQGARISARGKGKAILYAVGGLSKKGRQMIEVHKLL